MGKGVNRRTFVRGAAGAVGVGAVGAVSSTLRSANIAQDEAANMSQATVSIPVRLEGEELLVPLAKARRRDRVEWVPQAPLVKIVHIQWKKGDTPFPLVDLPATKLAQVVNTTVKADAAFRRYYYTIIAADDERTYVLDPPLDIMP